MSKIIREIADNALHVFAGQTIDADELGAYVEQQYALLSGGRRQTFGSFTKTLATIEAATEYTPSFTATISPRYTFQTV